MIERFSPADVAREAKLKQFREVTAPAVAQARHDLYVAAHKAEMEAPENEELRWLYKRGLRPVGGGAPVLPITLAMLNGSVVNNTFTGPQTLLAVAAAQAQDVGPHGIDYFKKVGSTWEQEAMGIISTTATPTIAIGTYWGVVVGTITVVLAISPTITTASGLANVDWYYKVMGRTVVSSGSSSTIIVTGILWGNIEALGATAATEPTQPVKNATPPTAVTVDLSSSAFIDLKATFSASAAGNAITTNFYKLASLYAA